MSRLDYGAVPAELRERDQWVTWKRERPRGRGKWTKVPYRVDGRTKAATDNPRTWGTFEQACAVSPADAQGIGYVFSAEDPFTGVDLDKCVDAGEIHPAASEILEALGGYREVSPSGGGMHAIVRGELRGDRHRTSETPWGGEFEVYDRGRFFTVTGKGAGEPVDEQAALDELVLRMFGEPSRNGAGPAGDPVGGRSAGELLAMFEDLGRFVARKGRKPGAGSASEWDVAMGYRAAEHECSDAELATLIVEARRRHGESKADDRRDYVPRTIAAVRRKVGHPARTGGEILARLTKDLHAYQVDLTVVDLRVSGHGNDARVAVVFSDGIEADFRGADLATPAKLGAGLATQVGIAAEFSTLQARRVAAHVRRYAGRTNEMREREYAITLGLDFLRLAETHVFAFAKQGSRYRMWCELDDHDPGEKTSTRTAEAFARKSIVAVDEPTGIRYARAGWFQEFVRRTGATASPADVMGLMVDVGWDRPGYKGRIKATDPNRVGKPITAAFYVVPADWQESQEAEE